MTDDGAGNGCVRNVVCNRRLPMDRLRRAWGVSRPNHFCCASPLAARSSAFSHETNDSMYPDWGDEADHAA